MSDMYKPGLHPDFSYSIHHVGNEKTPLLVVDNFLKDAHKLIEYCIEHYHFEKVDNYYPGRRMEAPVVYTYALHFFLLKLIESAFDVSSNKITGIKSLYSLIVTPPEELTIQQCLPHIDSFLSGDLACVHYLCGAEKGGTSLYRHKKTGYEKITEDTIELYQRSLIEEGATNIDKKAYLCGANDYFEPVAEIDAQFNRLIVYPSNILHCGNIPPGFNFTAHPLNGRLTLNSFIFCKR